MVDYTRWNKIEVSDDEDETHPNIDTPSLFKWRHEARVEREAAFAGRKQEILNKLEKAEEELEKAKKSCEGLSGKELDNAKKAMLKVEKKFKACLEEKTALEKEERLMPKNVDSLSKDGFQKTFINKPKPVDSSMDKLSEDEKEKLQREFLDQYEDEIKEFGMLQKYEDSKRFLQDHPHLVCEWTNNYLVVWCLNLEIEEKSELSAHVAHQSTCMTYVLELGKQLQVDPRSCVNTFFAKIQLAEKTYQDAFKDEHQGLVSRVRQRAREKIEAAVLEAEEEERQQRLGPGGLDPQEVLESLPEALQKCFETRDIDMLKKVIVTMDEDNAKYHINRCIASGLWLPQGEEGQDVAAAGAPSTATQ